MRELILGELRQLRQGFPALNERFDSTDIRVSFFDGYFENLRTYFCSWFLLDTDNLISLYNDIYESPEIRREDCELHIQGHKNIFNSMFIVNTWSNFELSITLFAEKVLQEDEINKLNSIDYTRIRKYLKDIALTPEIDNKLKKFNKQHLAHVPINNKFGKLFKLITNYPTGRDIKQDIAFLEFYGKLRNCIHSNFIYYGNNEYSHTFNGIVFTFNHGELINIAPQPIDVFVKLSMELRDVFNVLIENIEYDELIFDPTHNLVH